MNSRIENIIAQINNEDLEPEHDIRMLDKIRKLGNKNPQLKDFKEVEEKGIIFN